MSHLETELVALALRVEGIERRSREAAIPRVPSGSFSPNSVRNDLHFVSLERRVGELEGIISDMAKVIKRQQAAIEELSLMAGEMA